MKKYHLIIAILILLPLPIFAQEASLQTFFPALIGFISYILIPFLFGIAFLIFIINAIRYFVIESTNEDGREKAKNLALYSIAAFVFLVIFWGIVNLLTYSTGLEEGTQTCPDYLKEHNACPAAVPIPGHKPPVPAGFGG